MKYYSSKELKAMARAQLTGKYGTYIGAYLIFSLITWILSFVINLIIPNATAFLYATNRDAFLAVLPRGVMYLIIFLILSLIFSVMRLGLVKMILDGSRDYPVRLEDLFYGFRHHPDRVILMQFFLALIEIACVIPGYLMMLLGQLSGSITLLVISSLLLCVGGIFSIYYDICFCQCMFLMADYDDISPVQALKISRKRMKGSKGRFFWLSISFIGIYVLGVLSCGIGILWVVPYVMMTEANFYRNLGYEIPQPPAAPNAQDSQNPQDSVNC
jgi:uncharacterized membrane protein